MTNQERQNRIVARGESSNHVHVIVGDATVRNEKGEILIEVHGDASIKHLLETAWLEGHEQWTNEHTDIKLEKGTYKYVPQIEFDPYEERIRRVAD